MENIYVATTTDKFENIIDLAPTLKELCARSGISYSYCKKDLNKVFYNSKGTPIFIKKVDIEEEN